MGDETPADAFFECSTSLGMSVTTGTSRRYVAMHEGVKCEKGRGEDEDEWRRQFVYDLAILVAKES
eukprot:scaffold10571_cov130-Skeletonema_marinoi.AAC.2